MNGAKKDDESSTFSSGYLSGEQEKIVIYEEFQENGSQVVMKIENGSDVMNLKDLALNLSVQVLSPGNIFLYWNHLDYQDQQLISHYQVFEPGIILI